MKWLKNLSKVVVILLVMAGTVGFAGWRVQSWWQWAIAPPSSAADVPPQTVRFRITPGTSTQQIGQELAALGLIRSARAWELWARWLQSQDPNGGFQAGLYELSSTESLEEIARKIWQGDVLEVAVTIPEGWSLMDMANYFETEGFFAAEEFLAAAANFDTSDYSWLPQAQTTDAAKLEGYLYPDTYNLVPGTVTPEQVIATLLERFEQVALPLYQQAASRRLTLDQWVTLASIVEKEAVVPSERRRIAGVFFNRLQKNMPLAADPTVEYGLGIRQTPDAPLTLEEVRTPTPYNTYLNKGLPPTPIASPGKSSLQATLDPEQTDYLYFVARYDGTHVFSRTLAEHEAAQQAIRQARDRS